jgi:type III secretion protein C
MLLLDTTIDESLNYGVNWGARFDNGNTAGAEAFLSSNNALSAALDTAIPNVGIDVTQLARAVGYNLGIVGRNITRCGVEFSSIGALVSALHDKNKDDIILNPKILVEDNATAEIFVGINAPFKTQSIANDQ